LPQRQELGSFFVLLVVAGNETTRNAISHGMKALCDYPGASRAGPRLRGVAPTAVEEIVRWATPVDALPPHRDPRHGDRRAADPEGEKVVLWYTSANRDEACSRSLSLRRRAARPTSTSASAARPALLLRRAPRAPRDHGDVPRALSSACPISRITSEPDRLLSGFINGIKHMPCEFTPAVDDSILVREPKRRLKSRLSDRSTRSA
jgi:hypothetical protein